MLPIIAIPVLHSSGLWIASTAASGYVASTISSTWIGAFILGNSGLLSSLGLVSAGSIFAASGGLASMTAAVGTATGSALTAIGLGGLAKSLGLAPATFLGLTPIGWAATATSAVALGGLGYFLNRKVMAEINQERSKGGLPPTNITGILREIREYESDSMFALLKKLSQERLNFKVRKSEGAVEISDKSYKIKDLKYVVYDDGSEALVQIGKFWRKKIIFNIVGPNPDLGNVSAV